MVQIYKQTSEIYKACFDISQRVKCIFAVYRKFIKNGYTQHFRCIHLRKHPTTNSYMLSKLQFLYTQIVRCGKPQRTICVYKNLKNN